MRQPNVALLRGSAKKMKTNPPGNPSPTSAVSQLPRRTGPPQPALERTVRALGGVLGPTRDFSAPGSAVDRLLAAETAPFITNRTWLARHGLIFAPPKTLSPAELPNELRRLIDALAFARVFLSSTNHLNDEALYLRLYDKVLEADEPDVPRYEDQAFHWDLCEAWSDHHTAWLSYYASEEDREEHLESFPERPLPPSLPCPCDRDCTLPQPYHRT
jgi:hypothetical protein